MKIGADPELFLVDAANVLVSAVGKIGGTKEHPKALPIGEGFAMQEDNVSLEYNIPAADSKEQLVQHIGTIMGYLAEHVNRMGLRFSQDSAAFFPESELIDPRALEFGCDPDYNAWTKEQNPRPVSPNKTLRSCGGHVHIGTEVKGNMLKIVKSLDLMLAVPSVLMDKGQLRKQLYGKAGAFRPKDYGLEYRVLSNFWVFRPETVQWVWDNTSLALESDIDVDSEEENILDAVNNNNADKARQLIQKYHIPMLS